ncbi:response regulator transcription factor [Paenibacillus sp. FSL H7-0737]|uniref:response regulator transcription factor n=1 Tax=unclassified Paenibacillus TaxID=185978 RepID=UPI0004F8F25B|nr:response regulator transcription factor [Paenibacillus sp. FSL H7-0737]AIQ25404.1 PhoB family transcriptional regulator [Paenibacillus sp. FSL H7-0737]
MNKILLIVEEKRLARVMELELRHESYSITVTHEGFKGLQLALEEEWDLILLDLMIPGLSGTELCSRIRETKQTPIIIIAEEAGLADKIRGLDSGADDYILKPFAMEELLARMRSLLRRAGTFNTGRMLIFRDLEMDIDGRALRKKKIFVNLTKREFEILLVLLENRGRVMTREMLLETIWGYDSEVDVKVVDVYISYLRSKIDEVGQPSIVQTMRGLGYVIRK